MKKWTDNVVSKWCDAVLPATADTMTAKMCDTVASTTSGYAGTSCVINVPIDESFWTVIKKTRTNPIKKVIFNGPATIVFWDDGTKTIVKCSKNDSYDREKGLAMAIAKYCLGNNGKLNSVFKKFLKDE